MNLRGFRFPQVATPSSALPAPMPTTALGVRAPPRGGSPPLPTRVRSQDCSQDEGPQPLSSSGTSPGLCKTSLPGGWVLGVRWAPARRDLLARQVGLPLALAPSLSLGLSGQFHPPRRGVGRSQACSGNTYKYEEIEDKHQILHAAQTVAFHGAPPAKQQGPLSPPAGGPPS